MCGAAAAATAFEAPKVYNDASWQGVSPNGQYLVSNIYEALLIVDLSTDTKYTYNPNEETWAGYAVGVGNIVSNTGIVLSSNQSDNIASYWENGEWKKVEVPNETLTNCLMGVTPDGSRMCGNVGSAALGLDTESTMQYPAYWDRNADGAYSSYHMLPHPDKDFLGRTPQYITATNISDDGRAIIGQVVDYSGMFCSPILYTQNAEGEWSYTMLLSDMYKIEGEIPADPGDGPVAPEAEDYMNDEQRAAYNEAMEKWIESGYDYTLYPDAEDYLTEGERAQYDVAMHEYEVAHAAWQEKSDAFYEFFGSLAGTVPMFVFNSSHISGDGKRVVLDSYKEDDSDPFAWRPASINTPWVVDVETQAITKLDFGKSMSVTSLVGDDTYLACNGIYETPTVAYIIKDGVCTDMYDYLAALSPEMKEWMDQNLKHEIENFDWESGETTYDEYIFTGLPKASADMSILTLWTQSMWDWDYLSFGYVIDMEEIAAVSTVTPSADKSIFFGADGRLHTSGDISSVEVYDLSGRLQASDNASASRLSNGIYLVRGQRNDGSAITVKLAK